MKLLLLPKKLYFPKSTRIAPVPWEETNRSCINKVTKAYRAIHLHRLGKLITITASTPQIHLHPQTCEALSEDCKSRGNSLFITAPVPAQRGIYSILGPPQAPTLTFLSTSTFFWTTSAGVLTASAPIRELKHFPIGHGQIRMNNLRAWDAAFWRLWSLLVIQLIQGPWHSTLYNWTLSFLIQIAVCWQPHPLHPHIEQWHFTGLHPA